MTHIISPENSYPPTKNPAGVPAGSSKPKLGLKQLLQQLPDQTGRLCEISLAFMLSDFVWRLSETRVFRFRLMSRGPVTVTEPGPRARRSVFHRTSFLPALRSAQMLHRFVRRSLLRDSPVSAIHDRERPPASKRRTHCAIAPSCDVKASSQTDARSTHNFAQPIRGKLAPLDDGCD